MRENELKKSLYEILSAHVFIFSSSSSGDKGPGKVSLCCLESSG